MCNRAAERPMGAAPVRSMEELLPLVSREEVEPGVDKGQLALGF